MNHRRLARVAALLLTLSLVAAACSQRDDDGKKATTTTGAGGSTEPADNASTIDTSNCPTDPSTPIEGDTIKLVSSFPQSGLTAAFSQIANGWKAYFKYLNTELGGVEIAGKKYKIETADKDDQYNAQTTSQNIEEEVGTDGDKAFAAFSVVGTTNNVAIRDFLGDLCVPNLFTATGSPAMSNPKYPWTIGSTLAPYTLEGQVFAEYLKENKPAAKVAMLVQSDDFGQAYEEGFKQAIEGSDITVVKVEQYAPGANEVGAQITSLAATNADTFFDGGTLLACPDALSKAKQAGWTPLTWISTTCTSKTLMGIADGVGGNDNVLSMTNIKDPLNPKWKDDEAMKLYEASVAKYAPKGTEADNAIVAYGWTQGAILVKAMEAAKTASRLGVMESMHNLDKVDGGLLLPGITLTTGGDDQFLAETVNPMQYDLTKKYFELLGEPEDLEGKTADYTPADLITG